MLIKDYQMSARDYVTSVPITVKMINFSKLQQQNGPKVKTAYKKFRKN